MAGCANSRTSFGRIPSTAAFDNISRGLTIGMVLHPNVSSTPQQEQVLWTKPGVFVLSIADGKLAMRVNTTDGPAAAVMKDLLPTASAAGFVVKATYNSSSGAVKLFVDSSLVAQGVSRPDANLVSVLPGGAMLIGSADGQRKFFHGSLEELYIKAVSTEHVPGYLFSDDVRTHGTFLLDLLKPAGRTLYAKQVQEVLNQANFSNVQ